jgi:hypothetical protein
MATAKPKRMMFGGVAKGAMNSVKKAVAAKSAPMKMQNAARSAAQQAVKNAPAKPQMQFMSNKLRGAPMTQSNMQAQQRSALPPGLTKNPSAPTQSQMQAAAKQQAAPKQMQFMSDKLRGAPVKPAPMLAKKAGTVGTTGFKPGAKASFDSSIFGRKKGGVVKKATKK